MTRLGFQRFLSSDIFDYFAVMSDFSKSLENRLRAISRGFESHTLRHTKRKENEFRFPSFFSFSNCLLPIIHLVRQLNIRSTEHRLLAHFALLFIVLQRTEYIFAEDHNNG